jgi:hypothetical protein
MVQQAATGMHCLGTSAPNWAVQWGQCASVLAESHRHCGFDSGARQSTHTHTHTPKKSKSGEGWSGALCFVFAGMAFIALHPDAGHGSGTRAGGRQQPGVRSLKKKISESLEAESNKQTTESPLSLFTFSSSAPSSLPLCFLYPGLLLPFCSFTSLLFLPLCLFCFLCFCLSGFFLFLFSFLLLLISLLFFSFCFAAARYGPELAAGTARLVAWAKANNVKLLYAWTTPMLNSEATDAVITGTLNPAAAAIMTQCVNITHGGNREKGKKHSKEKQTKNKQQAKLNTLSERCLQSVRTSFAH